jgi:DNA-directed RNA polymerase specialized sigma24 family protein
VISSVAGPVSAPVYTRPVQPPVEPVPPVASVTASAEVDAQGSRGGRSLGDEAQRAVRGVDSPPEPVSTQSVLLLRQNGASIAGIAEAYGLSVQSVRRLLHAGRDQSGGAADER